MGQYTIEARGKHYEVEAETLDEAVAKVKSRLGPSEEELKANAVDNKWAAMIDTTPTQPRPRNRNFAMAAMGGMGDYDPMSFGDPEDLPPLATQENPDFQLKVENAAAQGVDTVTGLRRGVRGSSGLLAFDKNAQWASVEAALREEYGNIEIPEGMPLIFEDDSTGMPMYMRLTPEGKLRPTLVNPPGLDAGDIVEFAGELPTIALETIGGVGGAMLGSGGGPAGTVAGGVAGAGLMGATSIPLRVAMARKFGVPDDVIAQIKQGDEAAFQFMMSAGGELVGFGLEGTVSGLRNFFGRPLDVDDLPAMEAEIGRRMKKKQELQARRQANTGEEPMELELSLGELTGDPDILTAEANIMNQQVGKTAKEMRARQIRQEKSARQAIRDLATQRPRAPTDDGFRSVEEVSLDVRETLAGKPRSELEGTQLEAQTELTSAEQSAQLDSTVEDAYKVRDRIHEYKKGYLHAEEMAWNNYRRAVRWDPETRTSAVAVDNRGNTPIRQIAEQLAKDEKQAVLQSLSNAYRGTLENMGFLPQQVDEMVESDALSGLAAETLDPFHLHMAISHLKKELRALNAGDNSRGWEAKDLMDVITAIEDTMKAGPMVSAVTGKPLAASTTNAVRSTWYDANRVTSEMHELLDTTNMKHLLEVRTRTLADGTTRQEMPNLPAAFLRRRLFSPGDARPLIEAMEATGNDPYIRNYLVRELRKQHADTTIPNGRWSQTAHNKFEADYADHMKYLGLDPEITNVAQFGRQFDTMERELVDLEKRLAQQYGRAVPDPAKPLNIANEILSDRINFKQAQNIMRDLDAFDPTGKMSKEVRDTIIEKLDLDLSRTNNMLLNPGKLNNILQTQRTTLAGVFGPQYVKDLDLLREVMEITGERHFRKSTKELVQTHFTALMRSLWGPLSKKQRFLTSVQRVARHSRAGTVEGLLRDPNRLRQFVRLKNLSVRDPRYWIIVRGLGLTEYALDGDDTAQQAWEDFNSGSLAEEKARRETPLRYGSIQ